MPSKILVIDDDTRLRNLLGNYLEKNNFEAFLAKDTIEAENILNNNFIDLIIVDVMMPGENGIDFTKKYKQNNSIPIIILTARSEINDRVHGLEVGADDYLQKPFEPKELLLRIGNILKRYNINRKTIIKFGEFEFEKDTLRLRKNNEYIHITESEARILELLTANLGKAVTREEVAKLFGTIDNRSVDVQITRVRKKIEENPKKPKHLFTLRNNGYSLQNQFLI